MKRISYQAAAEHLGVKIQTLRTMVHRRQVPHIRLGPKLVVFDVETLDAWKPNMDEHLARAMQADIDDRKKGRDLYAIFCSVTRLCKIGCSNDAHERLREMQTGCPTRLVLWSHAPLLGDFEPMLHRGFAEFRLHGEWFSPALTERIASRVPQGDVDAFTLFAHEERDAAAERWRLARMRASRESKWLKKWRER